MKQTLVIEEEFEILTEKNSPRVAKKLFKNRWLLSIKGILSFFFGVFALSLPDITFVLLVIYLGLLLVVTGSFLIFGALTHIKHNKYRKLWFFEGIIDILIGLLITFYPGISMAILMVLLAIWIAFTGFMQIINWVKIKKHKWLWIFNGMMAFLMWVGLFLFPWLWATILVYILGSFAIVFGVVLTFVSFKLKNLVPNK